MHSDMNFELSYCILLVIFLAFPQYIIIIKSNDVKPESDDVVPTIWDQLWRNLKM